MFTNHTNNKFQYYQLVLKIFFIALMCVCVWMRAWIDHPPTQTQAYAHNMQHASESKQVRATSSLFRIS